MKYIVQKASIVHLPKVLSLFTAAIDAMNAINIQQWDETYPNKDILTVDIKKNQLFMLVDDGKDIQFYLYEKALN